MGIQAYELRDGERETVGAILVCTTSGRVLNLPIRTFEDMDDADAFVSACPVDPRKYTDEELEKAVVVWREFTKRYPVDEESIPKFAEALRGVLAP